MMEKQPHNSASSWLVRLGVWMSYSSSINIESGDTFQSVIVYNLATYPIGYLVAFHTLQESLGGLLWMLTLIDSILWFLKPLIR